MLRQSFVIPIIKVTDSCNYSCDFCYYAQRNLSSELMSLELCKNIIRDCFQYNVEQGNQIMRVIFHGGEPLLQPISFYKEIIDYEKYLAKSFEDFQFYNSIQTNGFFINQEWIEFFKKENFDIGISIDGPGELNCHFGKLGLKASSERVLRNIRCLNDSNIPFGIISVITDRHTTRAADLYKFCIENSIHDLSLNYCYNSESNDTVKNEKLIPFLRELFDLYYDGDYALNIREFNEMIAKIMGYCTDTCATCERQNCGQYISFDYKGNIFFCDSGYDKSTSIGNLNLNSLYEVLDSVDYLKMVIECRSIFNEHCKKCDVIELCGGGCHRHDILRNGKYEQNYFCPTQQVISRYIKEKVESTLD